MNNAYKYSPADYSEIPGLSDDLTEFYQLFEQYCADMTQDSFFALRVHWENLFFTIKHREVEGFISPVLASEIRDYLEELVNGEF